MLAKRWCPVFLVMTLLSQSALAQEPPVETGDAGETGSPVETPAPAPVRPTAPAGDDERTWEDKIDDAFGVIVGWVAYVPFLNVGPLLGVADEDRRDADGRLVIGPAGRDAEGNILVDEGGRPVGTVRTKVPFVVLWLVVAAFFFTFRMRFVNLRLFAHALHVVRGKYDDPDDEGEVSHFQALSSALSATVGLGNIAGVALAVAFGGPGATLWMVVAGLLGMTLKFTECTLGQIYRKVDEGGHVSGGPMHYLRDGLAKRGLGALGVPLSVFFTVCCIGGSLAGGNAFQIYQSKGVLLDIVPAIEEYRLGWVYGVVMAVAVGFVIIGGIRRIAQTAEKIVPLMCGVYVAAALAILLSHYEHIPAALGAIFQGAFTGEAVYGGALGSLVVGFQRAAFSNEAGVGSASIAHSAARTPYAVREGIVALLEPFIDTVVVCTMTALVIIITGVYNAPEHVDLVRASNGAALTNQAFHSVAFLEGWFSWVLLAAVVLFAFSTMISWSYYGERCFTHLFGARSSILYKLIFLSFVVLGSIISGKNALEFGDLMILIMAFPNILGLYFLGGEVKRHLGDYEAAMRRGEIQPTR